MLGSCTNIVQFWNVFIVYPFQKMDKIYGLKPTNNLLNCLSKQNQTIWWNQNEIPICIEFECFLSHSNIAVHDSWWHFHFHFWKKIVKVCFFVNGVHFCRSERSCLFMCFIIMWTIIYRWWMIWTVVSKINVFFSQIKSSLKMQTAIYIILFRKLWKLHYRNKLLLVVAVFFVNFSPFF